MVFPGEPVVTVPHFHQLRAQVQFLVGELKSIIKKKKPFLKKLVIRNTGEYLNAFLSLSERFPYM